MKCPRCDTHSTACIDSRESAKGRRRRYKCECGERFTTLETVAHIGDQRGIDISPDVIKQWRQETLDEVETALATSLHQLRDQYGLQEEKDE